MRSRRTKPAKGGYHELAALFRVGYRTLQRWVAQYRATDSVVPQPRGGGWRSPIEIIVLHGVVRERPDGTSEELCREYNRRVGRAGEYVAGEFSPGDRRVKDMCSKKTAASE